MSAVGKAIVLASVIMLLLIAFVITPAHRAWDAEIKACYEQGKTPIVGSHGNLLACIKEGK